MNFFESHDWLNREGPTYAFKLDHILFVAIGLLIGVALCFLLRKKENKTIKIVLIAIWAFAVAIELFYYGYLYISCINGSKTFDIEKMLPFHSCLMFLYVFPVAMFCKNQIIKTAACNFLVVINMIIGFITLFVGCPPVGDSALSFPGFQSLVLHLIIVIVPLLMVVTGIYDIQLKDIRLGLLAFATLGLTMWIFDAITGCDYFYFYDGHTFPVLKVISENVPAIVWTLIVVFCYTFTGCAIHFLIIGIKYLISKRKQKEASVN